MIKKAFFILALAFFGTNLLAQREVIDQVIAYVGGEIILLSELEEQYALLKERQSANMPADARCIILDNLLTQALLVNQAKIDSVMVTDEEVEAQLNARIDQILDYMGGDVTQFEEYYGQTVGEVKETFRDDLRSQLLAERMRADAQKNITVTPSEVKSFFRQIPKDSLPYFDSEVEIGEIVMKPAVNPEEREKAIKVLEGLREQIVERKLPFEETAKKYSDDFASARIGGDLGWTKSGKFVPAFEAAAYKLEEGEISPVVESEFGFHLIQLIGRRGNSIHTRHILIKPEITEADLELTRAKLDSVRQLLMKDSIKFSVAVKKFGFDQVQSYNNDGKMINPVSGNNFFEIADLEPDVYFTIDTMQVGTYSQPWTFSDPRGETFYRMVQLQSRTEPHVASLEKDYSKIQTAAIEQKKATYLANWIEEKVRSTYVRIDDYYKNCESLQKWANGDFKP